jgi:tripartite-type tricarboxylate transporter receptor subunit TctC
MTDDAKRGGPAHSQALDAPARRRLIGSLLAAPLAAVAPRMAYADVFPSQPLRLIVPFPAGGSSDILSRTLRLS